ncbi:NfeD family protein [Iamia sp.]|uniref:NfeD family protein n=1 Tax=Iamia sp. TaxID=2722710 RepID=UPI002B987A16|nr:NfeD family protein [Iamia sp.]HXH57473.1 NfeD family protein [Iamia sp.]
MTLFLILGVVGLVSLVVGLLVGEVDVDLGPDWLSLPVLAALVGAFGFVGAAALSLGAPTVLAVGAGGAAGLALAAATFRLARGLMHMATDAPLRSADLVGRPGRVVTALTAERTGEVLVSQAGQQLKMAARSDETITVGQPVVVVEIVSPTLVRVESHDRFWSPTAPTHPDTPQPDGGPPP